MENNILEQYRNPPNPTPHFYKQKASFYMQEASVYKVYGHQLQANGQYTLALIHEVTAALLLIEKIAQNEPLRTVCFDSAKSLAETLGLDNLAADIQTACDTCIAPKSLTQFPFNQFLYQKELTPPKKPRV